MERRVVGIVSSQQASFRSLLFPQESTFHVIASPVVVATACCCLLLPNSFWLARTLCCWYFFSPAKKGFERAHLIYVMAFIVSSPRFTKFLHLPMGKHSLLLGIRDNFQCYFYGNFKNVLCSRRKYGPASRLWYKRIDWWLFWRELRGWFIGELGFFSDPMKRNFWFLVHYLCECRIR